MLPQDRYATMTVFPQAQPFLQDLGIFVDNNDIITWPEVQAAYQKTVKHRPSKIKLDHLRHHYCLLQHHMILGERHGFFDSMSRYTNYIAPPLIPVKSDPPPIHHSSADAIVSSIFIGLVLILRAPSPKKSSTAAWIGLGCFALSGLMMVYDWLNSRATTCEEDDGVVNRPN